MTEQFYHCRWCDVFTETEEEHTCPSSWEGQICPLCRKNVATSNAVLGAEIRPELPLDKDTAGIVLNYLFSASICPWKHPRGKVNQCGRCEKYSFFPSYENTGCLHCEGGRGIVGPLRGANIEDVTQPTTRLHFSPGIDANTSTTWIDTIYSMLQFIAQYME